jgi:hypothetical protein
VVSGQPTVIHTDLPTVTFSFEDCSLTVGIGTDDNPRKVIWIYAVAPARPGGHVDGSGIEWRNGRLTSVASATNDARRFFTIMTELGLSFGQIEAELREMTGYLDGDP